MVLDLQSFKIELVPHEVPSFYFNMSLDEGRVMVLPFVTLTLATADSGPEDHWLIRSVNGEAMMSIRGDSHFRGTLKQETRARQPQVFVTDTIIFQCPIYEKKNSIQSAVILGFTG